MTELIRKVCALSIFCGVCMTLSPEGSAKRMLRFVSAVVLFACVAFGISNIDWDDYALQNSLLREREEQLLRQGEEMSRSLERRVIESKCDTYILDRADSMGIPIEKVQVTVQWSTEGVWVPYSVKLWTNGGGQGRQTLSAEIETDLGIPTDRQVWMGNA